VKDLSADGPDDVGSISTSGVKGAPSSSSPTHRVATHSELVAPPVGVCRPVICVGRSSLTLWTLLTAPPAASGVPPSLFQAVPPVPMADVLSRWRRGRMVTVAATSTDAMARTERNLMILSEPTALKRSKKITLAPTVWSVTTQT
jgi:hypothetical protein